MKIEIKEINNPYKFYNEVYGTLKVYFKKLYDNPYKKIMPLTTSYLLYCILCFIVLLSYIIISITVTSYSNIMLVLIGIVFVCFIIGFVRLICSIKGIKTLVNRKTDSIFSITKDSVSIENKIVGQKNELLWSDINYILVGKYSIGFMPKKDSDRKVAIYCSIDYKDKITKALEKYKKLNLLKENINSK